ncbi:MAG TPA: D-aminoacylase [Longimicrobiales bacterium]
MRRIVPLLVLIAAACGRAAPAVDVAPDARLTVIANGLVHDGSGDAPFIGDVVLRGDRIERVTRGSYGLANASGVHVIDATGHAVAPGFINMLSWADDALIIDPRSQSDIRQGVTLEVFGEGWSQGPLSDSMKAGAHLPGDSTAPIPWTTLGEYLAFLEQRGVAPNVASFVGATTVRIHVLGYDDVDPNAAQLDSMRALVRQAMREGALGLGTSLIYAPAAYAETDELVALAEEASRYGGMYISHMRSEGDRIMDAIDELIAIARRARIPAEIYHLKLGGERNWHRLDEVIARIDAARAEGLEITTNMYTYTAGATGLDAAMPPWVQAGGTDAWIARLQEPATRVRVLDEMRSDSTDWESLLRLAGSPDRVLLVGFDQDSLRYLTGKSLAEIATLYGMSPEETAVELVVRNDSDVGTVYFLMSEDNVRRQIALPYMTFGSDAGSMAPEGEFLKQNPHPRAYGNFARLLGRYVRDERVIALPEAVRRLTSMPAERLGIRERGRLEAGYHADVVVFDPLTIADHATFERPHQYATGVRDVFVNGVAVLRDGEHTGALPGRFVRGPGHTAEGDR